MENEQSRFHPFGHLPSSLSLPERMGNPFGYEVSDIAALAVKKLRNHIATSQCESSALKEGKMMGVLVVRDASGCLGFLSAYSGLMGGRNDWDWYVPPVFDLTAPDGYFKREEAAISLINARLRNEPLSTPQREALSLQRRQRSEALQQWIFQHYVVLNALGERRNLLQVWERHGLYPPGGAGDCCAPKLLNYAFCHDMTPISMAEFWVGKSPKKEQKVDGYFYPACDRKCRILLDFQLQGVPLSPMIPMDTPLVEDHPLGLFLPPTSRVLFLGSFPPLQKRWSMSFYYPNFNNDMWRIFGLLFRQDPHFFEIPGEKRFDKTRIVDFVTHLGVAFGDTALRVVREKGDSSDLHLKVVEPLDLSSVLRGLPQLQAVVVTGEKAEKTITQTLGLPSVAVGESLSFTLCDRTLRLWRMPSTSRAYPLPLQRKAEAYRTLFQHEGLL